MGLPIFDKRDVVRMVVLSNQEESQKFVDGGTGLFGKREIQLFLRM